MRGKLHYVKAWKLKTQSSFTATRFIWRTYSWWRCALPSIYSFIVQALREGRRVREREEGEKKERSKEGERKERREVRKEKINKEKKEGGGGGKEARRKWEKRKKRKGRQKEFGNKLHTSIHVSTLFCCISHPVQCKCLWSEGRGGGEGRGGEGRGGV